jgi:glycosyltransferase involved in cell wall biosynthesis
MRGAIRGFREHGNEVLPLIMGDILKPKGSSSTSVSTASSKGSIRSLIKKILPDKFRLLLRDIRTVWNDYKFERRTISTVKQFKPDAIYERASYLSSYGSRLAKRLNIPIFYETDGCMVEIISKDYGVFSEYLGNLFERRKMKQADYVVVMNKLTIPVVEKKFHLKKKTFLVKPLGIDPDQFNYNQRQVSELNNGFNLTNKFVIGFVGAISTYHGVNYLVEAASHLNKEYGDKIAVLIVGWSKEAETLKARADRENVSNIIFAGKVSKSKVSDYYNLMDVGVIPDCEESMYPIKVLEYGMFGLCPLVPDYPVFSDIITENVNGYFFTHRDPISLAKKIVEIYESGEAFRLCGDRWSTFVKGNFQWKDSVFPIIEALN